MSVYYVSGPKISAVGKTDEDKVLTLKVLASNKKERHKMIITMSNTHTAMAQGGDRERRWLGSYILEAVTLS